MSAAYRWHKRLLALVLAADAALRLPHVHAWAAICSTASPLLAIALCIGVGVLALALLAVRDDNSLLESLLWLALLGARRTLNAALWPTMYAPDALLHTAALLAALASGAAACGVRLRMRSSLRVLASLVHAGAAAHKALGAAWWRGEALADALALRYHARAWTHALRGNAMLLRVLGTAAWAFEAAAWLALWLPWRELHVAWVLSAAHLHLAMAAAFDIGPLFAPACITLFVALLPDELFGPVDTQRRDFNQSNFVEENTNFHSIDSLGNHSIDSPRDHSIDDYSKNNHSKRDQSIDDHSKKDQSIDDVDQNNDVNDLHYEKTTLFWHSLHILFVGIFVWTTLAGVPMVERYLPIVPQPILNMVDFLQVNIFLLLKK